MTRETVIARPRKKAREAAHMLGATFHEPIVDDLDLYYDRVAPRKVCAVIGKSGPHPARAVAARLHGRPHDRLPRAVSAAFFRGMVNYITDPLRAPVAEEITVYHALPWGLRDPLRRVLRAGQM